MFVDITEKKADSRECILSEVRSAEGDVDIARPTLVPGRTLRGEKRKPSRYLPSVAERLIRDLEKSEVKSSAVHWRVRQVRSLLVGACPERDGHDGPENDQAITDDNRNPCTVHGNPRPFA